MRRRVIYAGAAVCLLAVLWFFAARWCALLVDQVYTPRVATLQSIPIGWNGIWIQFGPGIPFQQPSIGSSGDTISFLGPGPDYQYVADLEVDGSGRLVLRHDGKSFVLGSRAGMLSGDDGVIPAFAAGPGDTTSVVVEHSLFSWPTAREVNWMTGHSPSWQRYLYYRLSWQKPSGERLSIVWQNRQDYYPVDGWGGRGASESIRIEIRQ